MRIGIVGAGPAGLAAAHGLRRQGYSDITVFERAPRAGGMVHSFAFQGHVFDLGAIWVSSDYGIVLELAREFGVTVKAFEPRNTVLTRDGRKLEFLRYWHECFALPETIAALTRLFFVWRKYARVCRPGYGGLPPELTCTAGELIARHRLEPAMLLLELFYTSTGYGFFDEVPAVYLMKVMDMLVGVGWRYLRNAFFGSKNGPLYCLDGGFQTLWERMAASFETRCNAAVTSVRRRGGTVEVTAGGETHAFDRVIVATAPHETLRFLDASPEERALLATPTPYTYVTTLFTCAGLPPGEAVYVERHVASAMAGHVIGYGSVSPDSPGLLGYQLAFPGQSEDELTRLFDEDLRAFGAHGVEIVARRRWTYFPHVTGKAAAAGFYDDVEKLQGRGGVYHVGSWLEFETTEHACRSSVELLRRHFAPTAALPAAPPRLHPHRDEPQTAAPAPEAAPAKVARVGRAS